MRADQGLRVEDTPSRGLAARLSPGPDCLQAEPEVNAVISAPKEEREEPKREEQDEEEEVEEQDPEKVRAPPRLASQAATRLCSRLAALSARTSRASDCSPIAALVGPGSCHSPAAGRPVPCRASHQ